MMAEKLKSCELLRTVSCEPMKLRDLVETSQRVAGTSSRLGKITALAELLRRMPHDEVEIGVAFLSGSARQGRIGIGWSAIREARSTDVAEAASLELREVDGAFAAIASISGAGSSRERTRALRALLARATRDEQDFLMRLLFGELRQGALEGVLVEAVARASGVAGATIRRAVMMAGDLGAVARAALEHGEPGLSAFSVRLFQPVQPMLAETAETIDAALESLGEAALEFKMDGARIQVHKSAEDVRVFTRNLRDVTAAAPEVVEVVKALPVREAILDGEVIALAADHTPHPFQVTMRRFGRKLDVETLRQELPLSAFFFDCLYVDGQPLIDEPQARRFAALTDAAPASIVIPHTVVQTKDMADAFLRDALDRGHEGVMAKSTTAGYAAGRRGASWLKLKVARTLDLVVLAAEWGHGRRTGWLSNLHLGARDPERNSFVMLGKTFKGMTDQMLQWQTEKLLSLELTRDDYTVYVRPELVVEVAFNDVQASPVYPGGLALRFARVKRYRPDKSAADAETFQTIQQIHQGAQRG
jgi:DNA ligase-1